MALEEARGAADLAYVELSRLRAIEAELRRAFDSEEKREMDAYREKLRSE